MKTLNSTKEYMHVCGEFTLKAAQVETVRLLGYGDEARTVKTGKVLTFAAYPSVRIFLTKSEVGFWHRTCAETGLKFSDYGHEKTQRAAIYGAWEVLENMRNSKNGAGSHAYVMKLVADCIERSKNPVSL